MFFSVSLMRSIYLDYNATTPIAPSVQEAMLPFLAEHFGDPASHHAVGRAAQEAMDDARHQVATLLAVDRGEIVFTSGGTESNNLALLGMAGRLAPDCRGHVVITALEHVSVAATAAHLRGLGFELTVVGCSRDGVVDPQAIEDVLRSDTRLVSAVHANHHLGSVQPVRQIAHLCRQRGILVHCDAAQTVGKIPVRPKELGVDLLSLSGHKMYAPKGIGALYVRRGLDPVPLLHGSADEAGLRPGTPNVSHSVALGQAAALTLAQLDQAAQRMELLRNRLESQLAGGFGERLLILAGRAERLPNTLTVSFPGITGNELLRKVPEICAATDSASHGGFRAAWPALSAVGLSLAQAQGTVRLSVGWYTTEEEVDRAASLLLSAWDSATA
ncbi:MAG: cysteine desulfurase family protein [Thermoguttaceae bacterium]